VWIPYWKQSRGSDDGLDRMMTTDVTPEGTVGYTYDGAGRRTGIVCRRTIFPQIFLRQPPIALQIARDVCVSFTYAADSQGTALIAQWRHHSLATIGSFQSLLRFNYKLGTHVGNLTYCRLGRDGKTSRRGTFGKRQTCPCLKQCKLQQ